MRVCIVNRAVGFVPAAFFVVRLLLVCVGGGQLVWVLLAGAM